MKTLALTAALFALPFCALAAEPAETAASYVTQNVLPWASNPVLIDAILAQNAAHAGMAQARIDELDLQWRAETGDPESALIKSVLGTPASAFLSEQIVTAGGTITEVFVMDNLGLNVAASAVTSDYWQGDEEKFTETFPKGAGSMHIGDIDYDESTLTYQIQVSFPMINPADGAVIGAMTVALDAQAM
jgi:hypothetical protein